MNSQKEYKKTISQISKSFNGMTIINDDEKIGDPYVDGFTTNQQRSRDKKITELLQLYVNAYEYKNKSNKWYKGLLFGLCMLILLLFTITLIVLVVQLSISDNSETIESIVQLVTVCVTFLTLIVGILKIITKYVFPANDEEYITRIVELIQNNDLENKKENIKAKTADSENKEDKSKSSDESFETINRLD